MVLCWWVLPRICLLFLRARDLIDVLVFCCENEGCLHGPVLNDITIPLCFVVWQWWFIQKFILFWRPAMPKENPTKLQQTFDWWLGYMKIFGKPCSWPLSTLDLLCCMFNHGFMMVLWSLMSIWFLFICWDCYLAYVGCVFPSLSKVAF